MTYKTILVHGAADAPGEARVKAALALGRSFEAAVAVAGAEAWIPYPVMSDSSFVSPELVQASRDALDERLAAAKAACERLCSGYEHPHSWRQADCFPDYYLADLAKGADLVVAGRPQKGDSDRAFANPATVIMQAGTPVLLLPPKLDAVGCETVLVAWKDTVEARRALADSLPFLRKAKSVVLLQVAPGGAEQPRQHDVLERLRRHEVNVTPDFRAGTGLGDGGDLLEAALVHRAELIVAGAYGHSRLREWAFGGVTQTLLRESPIPVLFSR